MQQTEPLNLTLSKAANQDLKFRPLSVEIPAADHVISPPLRVSQLPEEQRLSMLPAQLQFDAYLKFLQGLTSNAAGAGAFAEQCASSVIQESRPSATRPIQPIAMRGAAYSDSQSCSSLSSRDSLARNSSSSSSASLPAARGGPNRMSYPREFKLMVIGYYYANGQNKYRTCKQFQITKSMLNGWLQKADKIEQSRPGSLKSGRSGRRPQFPNIEKQLFEIYRQNIATGMKVGNRWIRESARQLALKQCNEAELKGMCQFSERWLANFKRRFGINLTRDWGSPDETTSDGLMHFNFAEALMTSSAGLPRSDGESATATSSSRDSRSPDEHAFATETAHHPVSSEQMLDSPRAQSEGEAGCHGDDFDDTIATDPDEDDESGSVFSDDLVTTTTVTPDQTETTGTPGPGGPLSPSPQSQSDSGPDDAATRAQLNALMAATAKCFSAEPKQPATKIEIPQLQQPPNAASVIVPSPFLFSAAALATMMRLQQEAAAAILNQAAHSTNQMKPVFAVPPSMSLPSSPTWLNRPGFPAAGGSVPQLMKPARLDRNGHVIPGVPFDEPGKRGRKVQFPEVEEALFRKFQRRQAEGVRISNRWLQEEARSIASIICPEHFADAFKSARCMFSEHWLHNFKKRFGISLKMPNYDNYMAKHLALTSNEQRQLQQQQQQQFLQTTFGLRQNSYASPIDGLASRFIPQTPPPTPKYAPSPETFPKRVPALKLLPQPKSADQISSASDNFSLAQWFNANNRAFELSLGRSLNEGGVPSTSRDLTDDKIDVD